MKNLTQYNPMPRTGACPGGRRGNSMVLVAGILVLLVIIATAFITRAQTSRLTAASQLAASKRNDTSRAIADSLAQIVSEALFVRKIIDDPNDNISPNNSNFALGRFDPFAVRYEWDVQRRNNPNDDFAFNHPPFQVVPFTNWPDSLSPEPLFPEGPGNVGGGSAAAGGSPFLASEGNPIGNPGFGDTRWLRDLEPLRFDSTLNSQFDTFSHWRHLTNIAHANNAWRICRDISDIFDNDLDGNGGLLLELNVPVEQWLADPVPMGFFGGQFPIINFFARGNLNLNSNLFFQQWRAWFSSDYFLNYSNPNIDPGPPPNFYNLSAYGPPSDEFRFNTERNMISRFLADADGDGFTDSFWFLAPTSPDSGIRQIVGVSITDNSARLNANVATRFRQDDPRFPDGTPRELRFQERTIGATPSDLALVGDFTYIDTNNLLDDRDRAINDLSNEFVGFFDSIRNWERNFPNLDPFAVPIDSAGSPYLETSVEYDPRMWEMLPNSSDSTVPENFLGALGILNFGFNLNSNFNTRLFRQRDRLLYWRNAASRPFDAKLGLTPFGTDSELELRMFEGQNYPWIVSSFENAVQSRVNNQKDFQLLRGNVAREESSEYLDQLDAGELLFDARRKLTLLSGARNDLMPPWLWWRWNALPQAIQNAAVAFPSDNEDNEGNEMINGNGVVDVIDRFLAQARRKLDLRERDTKGRDGLAGNADDKFFDSGELNFDNRLAHTLLLALADGDEQGGDSYLGPYTFDIDPEATINQVRKLAASYAANIRAYRDADSDSTLAEAEPLPQFDALPRDQFTIDPTDPEPKRFRFLGLEKQPFLVEAFIAHVYRAKAQLTGPHPGLPPGNVLCDDASFRSTMVVVQIANPFDTPISLDDFQIKLFDFSNINPTGLLDPGQRRTFYLIENDVAGDPGAGLNWKQALELTNVDVDLLANPGLFVDVTPGGITSGVPWPVDRDFYDTVAIAERNIELVRIDDSLGELVEVVVDRFDMPMRTTANERFAFGDSVGTELANTRPAVGVDCTEPAINLPWPGVVPVPFDNMVFASRVTRAWDLADAPPANNEKSPRYIFHDRKVVDAYWGGLGYNNGDDPLTWLADDDDRPRFGHRNKRFFGEPGRSLNFPLQMLQKDGNFDQVGELLNVWLFSHELRFADNGALFFIPDTGGTVTGFATVGLNTNGDPDGGTVRTFSEYLAVDNTNLAGEDIRVNRLQVKPNNNLSPVIGIGFTTVLNDFQHMVPDLPAGARVLDAFVCDDFGLYMNIDLNGFGGVDINDRIFQENNLVYGNAIGFTGRGTPGLININTAPVEVMRAMPQMDALVHSDPLNGVPSSVEPFVAVPQAIVHYRERFSGAQTGFPGGAIYTNREPNVRGERGISSIGELMLLETPATSVNFPPLPVPIQDWGSADSWRMDFAGQDPYSFSGILPPDIGAFISTDVQGNTSNLNDPTRLSGDAVSEDVEEANLLFAGISNLITTRSDMFTVHFIVRSFRRNPITGIWDATDREQIVDERRYVMLVDRSEVNKPSDRPRILYLEKLPN